ncbi:hypothetical protein BB558_006263 [Smittium angustum]|uniref:Uncharacterized protein n=1 Tax=Smittium angustum TaxID=133377 RepID=A0A2U1IY79_SMIAN|nr:hypothetical protein BB558_006263 [Smittium angustum]
MNIVFCLCSSKLGIVWSENSLGEELKASVSQLHASRDFYGENMVLDTDTYLILIVATRASITNNIVAQHALLNQHPIMGRESLERQSGVAAGIKFISPPRAKNNKQLETHLYKSIATFVTKRWRKNGFDEDGANQRLVLYINQLHRLKDKINETVGDGFPPIKDNYLEIEELQSLY